MGARGPIILSEEELELLLDHMPPPDSVLAQTLRHKLQHLLSSMRAEHSRAQASDGADLEPQLQQNDLDS